VTDAALGVGDKKGCRYRPQIFALDETEIRALKPRETEM
jgi:hypothetical protein